MKLSNFEQHINSTILQHGQTYINAIITLEEISTGEWEASVEGTDSYTVTVELSDNDIKVHYCDCPYNWGDVCKHEVAVFYALRDRPAHLYEANMNTKTIKEKIQLILDKLSETELRTYIQQEILDNKKVRDHFLIHFNHLLAEKMTPDKYRQIVQNLMSNHSDYGYIDYGSVSKLCKELNNLLAQAETCMVNNSEQSLAIAIVVLEELPKMAESMDDSNGSSSEVAQLAVQIIINYMDKQTDQQVMQKMFRWCMLSYLDEEYSDYGYDEVDQLFKYFCFKESPFQQELLHVLDKKIAQAVGYKPYLLKEKVRLLTMWGDKKAALDFIMDNLDEPELRQLLVDDRHAKGNIEEAIKLIKTGLQLAENLNQHGTIIDWQIQLLHIAQQQKDQKNIAHWSEKLLFDNFSIEYYRVFKHASNNWSKHYKKLIQHLKKSSDSLAKIYIEEQDNQALFALIKQSMRDQTNSYYSRLTLLRTHLDRLIPDYGTEILAMFVDDIYKQAEHTGRHIYDNIVEDLSRMQAIPTGQEQVAKIVIDFQVKYKNRPLMQKLLKRLS
jgi:uncharacterized Zn finger protein